MKNQFCFWHTLHFWRFIDLVQKCIDQFKGSFFDTACKKTGAADTAESSRKQMHQESPDEFFCGNGHLFHSVRGSMIILVTECDFFFIIRQDPAVWYRSTVCITREVAYCIVSGFLLIRFTARLFYRRKRFDLNIPCSVVTCVQKFFPFITVPLSNMSDIFIKQQLNIGWTK